MISYRFWNKNGILSLSRLYLIENRIHFGNLLFSVLHYFHRFIQGLCKSLSWIFSFRTNGLENIFSLHYLTKRKCMTLCKQWNNTRFAITQSKYPATGKCGRWDVREFFKTNSEASCLVIQIGNYFLLKFFQEERYVFCRCDWHVQNSKCNGYSSILRQSFNSLKIKEKQKSWVLNGKVANIFKNSFGIWSVYCILIKDDLLIISLRPIHYFTSWQGYTNRTLLIIYKRPNSNIY